MSQTRVIPPSESIPYWLGEIKNNIFAEGQPASVFLPGLGERVSQVWSTAKLMTQGSKAATEKVNRWIVDMGDMPAAADHFKYNIVTVAPKWEYESGEIIFAIRYAKEVLKASKVVVVINSLGGYGLAIEVHKNPDLAKMIDAIIWIVMGPGMRTNTAKHLAEAKVPNLFITAENDTVTGTTPQATINLHKAIVAAGGISWLIVLKAGQYTDKNAHGIINLLLPAWHDNGKKIGVGNLLTTAEPLGEKGIKNIVTRPTMSIHKWGLLNSRVAHVAPDANISEDIPVPRPNPGGEDELPNQRPDPIITPIPKPDPIVVPPVIIPPVEEPPVETPPDIPPVTNPPVPQRAYITRWTNSNQYVLPPSGYFEVWWSDGHKDFFRAEKGDSLMSSYGIRDDETGLITFNIDFAKAETKIVGPYREV